jgi:hypothetical protein
LNTSTPLTLLCEDFETITVQNNPLVIEHWLNVATKKVRPWWGFNDGGNRVAKATGYDFYGDNLGNPCEMWLITPALDAKNTNKKTFSFKIKGDFLPSGEDEKSLSTVELWYMSVDDQGLYKEIIPISVPDNAEGEDVWIPYVVDFSQSEIDETFFMAFKFVGPYDKMSSSTYYLDSITWGMMSISTNVEIPVKIGANDVKVYPNPVTENIITIESKNIRVSEPIEIYNSNGQKVRNIKASGTITHINMQGLPNGVYFIKTEKNIVKIIKK